MYYFKRVFVKFYNRENELKALQTIEKNSNTSSKMTIIIGRRRIGKTTLIKKVYPKKVYFFVSKKNETLLCEEFKMILEKSLNIKVLGEFKEFAKLFEYIMVLSQTQKFTLIIDEFQEFLYINSSIFSDIQNIWDEYKDNSKLNLILSGSIYSLMKKIFEDRKEPLFGRSDKKIVLKPFNIITLKQILKDNYPNFTNKDLLSFYIFTGGVAKYVEIFVDNQAFTFETQLDLIFEENSIFLDEGKNILIEEFGKEYGTYFSILSLISSGKTSRTEIESVLEKTIGGYLDRLENDFMLIKKIKPIFAKEGSRKVKYEIMDNFFNFWFRFIYKYKSAIEIENYEFVKEIVKRDFSVYSGKFLEKYFVEKFKLSKEFSNIGNYWEKANQNEIDIVAINEFEKRLVFAEVKLNKNKIDLEILKQKSQKIVDKFKNYKIEYKALSLEEM